MATDILTIFLFLGGFTRSPRSPQSPNNPPTTKKNRRAQRRVRPLVHLACAFFPKEYRAREAALRGKGEGAQRGADVGIVAAPEALQEHSWNDPGRVLGPKRSQDASRVDFGSNGGSEK